jgi:hypothetical protein
MRTLLFLPVWFLLCLVWATGSAAQDQNEFTELTDLLPQVGEVDDWAPDGKAQYAAGEDLFLLINGGAEIYHEYGFDRCALQTYASDDGRSINVEIYKMIGPQAAYGIFSFKRSNNGIPVEIGHDGSNESYYIIFWRGKFLVTVIALDDWDGVDGDIRRMAGAFDAKINSQAKRPRIISFLPEDDLQANGITYLRGNLALFNYYLFAHDDIFGLKEGVIGEYEDHTLFVFQYDNPEESAGWYKSAKNHLTNSSRFDNFVDGRGQFEIRDGNQQRLTIKHFSNWIFIVMADKKINTTSIFDSVKTSIKRAK